MSFTTLIKASELSTHIRDEDWAVIDCRFSLDKPEQGLQEYLESHITGAVYAHLDHDLSGAKISGATGRHPLPKISTFAETLSSWGVDSATQVVVYDDSGGSIATRLWWMLKWAGHERSALLDGGWRSWRESGLTVQGGPECRPIKRFEPLELPDFLIKTEQVQNVIDNPDYLILDARTEARYLGEVEPIDPIAGHIPGAISSPFQENLTPEGKFLAPEILQKRYKKLIKSIPTTNVICYCGSGVTAAHNLLAMVYAGLGMGKLYAGSWSEWIFDPARPIARGPQDKGLTK
jgi:thiosulfate/3-mercaptopyruvate sulfurtransferase